VRGGRLALLTLGALGVVYGDIGTSPLYALRECFNPAHGVAPTSENIIGILSLIFWALMLIVSVKYLIFVLRADNKGEGGILALMALVTHRPQSGLRSRALLIGFGLFGAALLYGDGIVTPAISVLSAVEGLSVGTHVFEPYVVPIAVVILLGLFIIQSRGTQTVGALFGPVMVVWFITLIVLGLPWIAEHPMVLKAFNPWDGMMFLWRNGWMGFIVLGSVFLVCTGGEALYADMGHFGRRPIRQAWFGLVLPALFVNYLGQGAMLLDHPENSRAPFYLMAPGWALYPLVGLAALAAVIASQALISGAFSLTRQAIQLGYCPRLRIEHTSASQHGQIYMPEVNWALMLATIGLVIGFKNSGNLAAAYGIAVGSTMVITTMLAYLVAREQWGVRRRIAGSLALLFLAVEVAFLASNALKIPHGGWFPLVVGLFAYLGFSTWKEGRALLGARLARKMYPFDRFLKDIAEQPPYRVPGTAIFMTSNQQGTPPTLLHNLEHNRVLHERVILLTVATSEVPYVPDSQRAELQPLGQGFYRVALRYGFMQEPDVPAALMLVASPDFPIDLDRTTFFLGIETLLLSDRPGMPLWKERLFVLLSRNAVRATSFFKIPPQRVVEIGIQVEL
jgi:KUP system potassium uptake protein